MTPERFRQIEEVFGAVADLRAEARAAALDRLCGGDASLRGEVESLLSCLPRAPAQIERAIGREIDLVVQEAAQQGLSRGGPARLDPGTRVGPYVIAELLGAGGMGEVYRAHDERLERDVAVKLMSAEASGDAVQMRRMEREARAAGQLSHPNILAVFDVGALGGRMYVVTELLEGESLRDVVRRGPLPWRTALKLCAQVAEGLAAAHERGIVHRDIKPDNVFLTRDGRIKILDFGVATVRAPVAATATAMTVSQGGLVVGTVGYMSPEQARGEVVDHRSDLFSFGCLMYELLSGREAFGGGTPMAVLVAVQRDAPAPLQDIVSSLPADVVAIVDRCLEKDPARRFQSTRDLLFALSLVKTGPHEASSPDLPAADAPAERASAERASAERASAAAPHTAPRGLRFGPRLRGALSLGLALLAGAAATAGAHRVLFPPQDPPVYRQITFRRGTIYTARFTLDGAGLVYSAAWGGGPRELFTTVPGTRDSRSLDQAGTDAVFMLASGEIGVIRRPGRSFTRGVLSRISLAGGPPKDWIDGVNWADSDPSGSRVVVARNTDGRATLELPPGRVVAEATAINYPRFSPDAAYVAFLEHPEFIDDAGRLVVIDRDGKRVLESESWKSIEGLAWRSPSEIWFTASKEGRSLEIRAMDLKGRSRLLCRVPGRLVLHDVSRDGRAVAERNSYRARLMVGTGDAAREQEISWQDYSRLGQLSRDGRQVLFSEQGDGAGAGVAAYLRPLEGGAPVRLGGGVALALSQDAHHALLRVEEGGTHLEVVPVGAGRTERLPAGPLANISWAAFVPGSSRVVMLAKEAGKGERLYVQDLTGGDPRPLTAEGVTVTSDALSPNGDVVAAKQKGRVVLIPLDGGAPRELPGLTGDHVPVGWTGDGRALFVRSRITLPMKLYRYDLAGEKLDPWRALEPLDPAGVYGLGRVSLARDGEVYVYESYQLLSDLYVIENLR